MISKQEYEEKYSNTQNNYIIKSIEKRIDDNIKNNILEAEYIIETHLDYKKIQEGLSSLTDKYRKNGWDNLFFILDKKHKYPWNFYNTYIIKYILS